MSNPLRPALVAALGAALSCLSACGESTAGHGAAAAAAAPAGDQPYRIVATTAMIADIAANVAGTRARVQSLMGQGVDPHLYRPTRDDVTAMLQADVVFYNGLNLEGKMSDTFVRVARSGKPVYAVTELIEPSYLLHPPAFAGHDDPHVWMDPQGWIKATQAVMDALSEFDPPSEAAYRAAGSDYIARLQALDDYTRRIVATIPAQRRVLVTAHDAFNYFARAYDMEVEGIQGISTESEAGLQRIERLVTMLVERNIRAVFTETSVSPKNIQALVEGVAARGHAVQIGGSLFSDAMGAPGTYEGTYIGMIDHNATIIVRALGGEAPQRGLNGKLGAAE